MFHKEGQKIIFVTLVFVVATSLLIDNLQLPWLAKLIQFTLLVILVLSPTVFQKPKTSYPSKRPSSNCTCRWKSGGHRRS